MMFLPCGMRSKQELQLVLIVRNIIPYPEMRNASY